MSYTHVMKTAISIPDQLFSAGERLAGRLGISRSRLYQRALQEFLHRYGEAGVTDLLDKIYGDGGEVARIDPLLAKLQSRSLERGET